MYARASCAIPFLLARGWPTQPSLIFLFQKANSQGLHEILFLSKTRSQQPEASSYPAVRVEERACVVLCCVRERETKSEREKAMTNRFRMALFVVLLSSITTRRSSTSAFHINRHRLVRRVFATSLDAKKGM